MKYRVPTYVTSKCQIINNNVFARSVNKKKILQIFYDFIVKYMIYDFVN